MLNPIMVMSRAVAPVPPALTRTTLGRLYTGDSVPLASVTSEFIANDWVVQSGEAFAPPFLSSGNLVLQAYNTSPGTYSYYNGTIAARSDAMVFVRIVGYGRTQLVSLPFVRGSANVARIPDDMIHGTARNASQADSFGLFERVTNVNVQSDSGILAIPGQTVALMADGASAQYWASATNTTRTLSGIGLLTAGRVGLGHYNFSGFTSSLSVTYSRVMAHASRYVTVTGPFNFNVELRDATNAVIVSGSSVANSAVLDLWAARSTYSPDSLPLVTKIVVINPITLQELANAEPAERIWGGDVWVLS